MSFSAFAESETSGSAPTSPPSSSGFTGSLDEGDDVNDLAIGINAAMGIYMARLCKTSDSSSKPMYCLMAAQSLLQVTDLLDQRDNTKEQCNVIQYNKGECGPGGNDEPPPGSGDDNPPVATEESKLSDSFVTTSPGDSSLYDDLKGIKDDLSKQGYSLDVKNKTVTVPDGKTISSSKLGQNIKDAGPSLGLNNEQAAEWEGKKKAIIKKYDKKRAASLLASKGGSANSFSGSKGSGSGSSYSGGRGRRVIKSVVVNRKLSSVAGLTRSLSNGDPVGVAADDLFKMVHRKYQAKRSINLFNEVMLNIKN